MICIDSFKPQRHGEFEFDAIPVFPRTPDGGKSAGPYWIGDSLAIDRQHWIGRGPAGNADIKRVIPGLRTRYLDLDFVVERVLGFLLQSVACAPIIPLYFGWREEIYVNAIGRAQIGADVIVGGELREGS